MNNITEFNLESVLQFGKYNGNNIKEIYQYHPSYIEWLIKYIPEFYIDINLFKDLPIPTPFTKKYRHNFIDYKENQILAAKEFQKQGNNIPQKIFEFSEDTIKSLEEKQKGIYKQVIWKSTDFNNNSEDWA